MLAYVLLFKHNIHHLQQLLAAARVAISEDRYMERPGQLRPALEQALAYGGPSIVEIISSAGQL